MAALLAMVIAAFVLPKRFPDSFETEDTAADTAAEDGIKPETEIVKTQDGVTVLTTLNFGDGGIRAGGASRAANKDSSPKELVDSEVFEPDEFKPMECQEVVDFLQARTEDPRFRGGCQDNCCPDITLPAGEINDFNANTVMYSRGNKPEPHTHYFNMDGIVDNQITTALAESGIDAGAPDERCEFIKNKLGLEKANDHVFFNDSKLLTPPADDKGAVGSKCYLHPRSSSVSYDAEGCSKDNHHLYSSEFDDVVESIGMEVHKYVDETIHKPMCSIRFKEDADPQKLEEYLQYLYVHQPEREHWQESTAWLYNKHWKDTETMASYMKTINIQHQHISSLKVNLNEAVALNAGLNAKLDNYLATPSAYMRDYVLFEGSPDYIDENGDPGVVDVEDAKDRSMLLATAAVEQVMNAAAEDLENRNGEIGSGVHLSRLWLDGEEDDDEAVRRINDEWVRYADADQNDRRQALSNMVIDYAVIGDVWNRHNDAPGETDYEEKTQLAAKLPFGPAGYTHVADHCTFRDEGQGDSCESHFLQGCSFGDIRDKAAQAGDICRWSMGKNTSDWNCDSYGDLFKIDTGVPDYFGRLETETSVADAELNKYLRSEKNFTFEGDGECVYRETQEGSCDPVFRDQCATVDVGSESDVPLLRGESATVADPMLVQAAPRRNAAGKIEIVGNMQTTVNPPDTDHVVIVDASSIGGAADSPFNGSLDSITSSSRPVAKIKQGSVAMTQAELNSLNSANENLAKDLENCENEKDQLGEDLEDCNKDKEDLQKRLQDELAECNKQKQELLAATATCSLEGGLNSGNTDCGIDRLSVTPTLRGAYGVYLKTDINTYITQNQTKNVQIQTLNNKIKELEDRIAKLLAQISSLDTQINSGPGCAPNKTCDLPDSVAGNDLALSTTNATCFPNGNRFEPKLKSGYGVYETSMVDNLKADLSAKQETIDQLKGSDCPDAECTNNASQYVSCDTNGTSVTVNIKNNALKAECESDIDGITCNTQGMTATPALESGWALYQTSQNDLVPKGEGNQTLCRNSNNTTKHNCLTDANHLAVSVADGAASVGDDIALVQTTDGDDIALVQTTD